MGCLLQVAESYGERLHGRVQGSSVRRGMAIQFRLPIVAIDTLLPIIGIIEIIVRRHRFIGFDAPITHSRGGARQGWL